MAVALVIAVVAVAYGTGAPTLGVAEFAPSAQTEVSAPPTTGGARDGGQAARSHRSTTTTTAAVATTPGATEPTSGGPSTVKPRGRQCYGDPPRQTEDPMAPPCIPTIFEGNNGGATAKGTSATEIRVAITAGCGIYPDFSSPEMAPLMNALFDYFNRSFEFYGRRLVPEWVPVSASMSTPVGSRAVAVDIAQRNVFSAITGLCEWGSSATAAFPQELARQHIVTITRNAGTFWTDSELYDFMHPYVWSTYPSAEDIERNFASFACTALVGRPASHAGDTRLQDDTRKFGIVSIGQVVQPPTAALARQLEACTGEAPAVMAAKSGSTDVRTGLQRFKDQGVTSVFCLCYSYALVDYAVPSAHAVGYHPEWLVTAGQSTAHEYYFQYYEGQGAFGSSGPIELVTGPRMMPLQGRQWFPVVSGLTAMLADTANISGLYVGAEQFYTSLLTLAAGIQAAGPNLTPDSFAAGLMNLQFPNPGAGQGPLWLPSAGFGPGDHSLFDDYAIGWWNNDVPAVDYATAGPTGSWCYLGAGTRFTAGSYPSDADSRLFNPSEPCR